MGVSALEICINIAICCLSERGTVILPDFPPEGDPKAPGLALSAIDTVASVPEPLSPEVTGTDVDVVTDIDDVVVVLETEKGGEGGRRFKQ